MALQTFGEIVGHQAQIQAFGRLIAGGKPGHAYLFEGPESVGKTCVAQAVLQRLSCLQAQPQDPEACGECRSCVAAARGEHPDLTTLTKDGTRIKIDQVRAATERLKYEPILGKIKGILIDEADTLGEEAANALLKTLEEPWSNTLFILITAKPQLLLETIRSRCQIMRFADLSPKDVARILLREGIDPDTARIAAGVAGGALREARELCHPAKMQVVDRVSRFVLNLGEKTRFAAADFIEELGHELAQVRKGDEVSPATATKGKADFTRADLLWTVDTMRAVLRDVVLVQSGISTEDLPNRRHAKALQALADRAGPRQLVAVVDACQALENRLNLNPNPRMAMIALFTEASGLLR